MADPQNAGKVYLVGAGPGDPKLITVRGAEAISRADVIVCDRLASPKLLAHPRADVEIIYAGKASRDHTLTQDEINNILVDRALAGKTVVRLKGGDPFVFGRGGEEAEALAKNGIRFEVIPGISSAIAAPAYAGIPVTHRGVAVSLGIITGHEADAKNGSDVKWDKIATGLDTLVFLMGVEHLQAIVDRLIENGRSADTPVALVRWGTHPSQKTLVATLSDVVEKAHAAKFTAPAVTIVGDVVRLRETISWFENRPLFGKRIIVTRAQKQASVLSSQLEELGAEVIEIPVIKFAPPSDLSPLDRAISHLDDFDWIIFTSANGVEAFVNRLFELGKDIRALGSAKLGAIGPKTAVVLESMRLRVDYVPSQYIAEAIISEFPEDINGKSILIPRAGEARRELVDGLEARGASIEVPCAYETVIDDSCAENLARELEIGVNMITFTSASTVRNFIALAADAHIPDNVIIACIGPITADAARQHGLNPTVIAEQYTIEGLINAIISEPK